MLKLTQHSQQGAALVISLIILVLLGVLGLTALQSSRYEARMGSNTQDKGHAFHAAETALREAENWLQGLNNAPTPTNLCAAPPVLCNSTQHLTLATKMATGGRQMGVS